MSICVDLSKQVIDTAEVIKTAKELYDFVNDKSQYKFPDSSVGRANDC